MGSNVRTPVPVVTLDGIELGGVISVEVHSNNHFAADRFRIQFAAQSVTLAALQIPGRRYNISIVVDGVARNLIVGMADTVSFDPTRGIVDVEGRDLAALMIEAQTDETFSNRTSSEIARILAERHGLAAYVDSTTSATGRFYQSEHARVTLGQFAKTTTEWDLLAFLASREGFDLYMDRDTLHFGMPSVDAVSLITPADCIRMQLQHFVALARPMLMTVKSWNSKSADTTLSSAQTAGTGPPWIRTMTRPNLTPDEAKHLAERTVSDTKRHEWTVSLVMPGETSVTPRGRVNLLATGSAWDRMYAVSQVSRYLDAKNGFTQSVTLQGVP